MESVKENFFGKDWIFDKRVEEKQIITLEKEKSEKLKETRTIDQSRNFAQYKKGTEPARKL